MTIKEITHKIQERVEHFFSGPETHIKDTTMSSLRLEHDMRVVIDALGSLNPLPIENLSPSDARVQPTFADAVKKASNGREVVLPVASRDLQIDGAVGPLSARLYTPSTNMPTNMPIILYFHGGGWVIADKDVYDAGARGIAAESGAMVLSVDYRQAPEHKFPAAWDDALAAYKWLLAHREELGATSIGLAGESAGGNLAVATAVAVREAGLPMPYHILSVYPVAQTSLNTESYIENALAKPLNRAMVQWFVDHLIRSEADLKDTRLSLVDANLRGLPPVTIINASVDPLRSDGEKLANALRQQGVAVERQVYNGVTHEFFGGAAVIEKAKSAQQYAGRRLTIK